MALNPNNEYVLSTSLGDYLILTFKSDTDITTLEEPYFFNSTNLKYRSNIIDIDSFFRFSFIQAAAYRYQYTSIMNSAAILGVSGGVIENTSNGTVYFTLPPLARIGGAQTMGNTQGVIDLRLLCMVLDDYDNAHFNVFRFRADSATAAIEDNTSNTYGFCESKMVALSSNLSFAYSANAVISNFSITDLGKSLKPFSENIDPYAQGGTSGSGGGSGDFDLSSDSIDFPNLPTLTAVSTGLVSLYTPTLAQLNSLANYLWSASITDVDTWKKLIANPIDLILGLSIVPVQAPAGAAQNIKVGLIDTGVSVTKCASQYISVDCGSLNVTEFWGSALDYSPFRKHSIYLPFIGTRTINTDDIMGKTVHVKYNIDLLSGACTAMVKCGDAVLYQYSGACAVSIPLTGQTFTDMITSTIQLAASIGATVATGGAAAGITAASAANSVMSMKPTIERAGGVSGAAGQLGVMQPYLIGEIPRQSVPENYNTFAGYPSNIKATLGELSGYTEIETIYLKGIAATSAELDEIERLLKEGVYL